MNEEQGFGVPYQELTGFTRVKVKSFWDEQEDAWDRILSQRKWSEFGEPDNQGNGGSTQSTSGGGLIVTGSSTAIAAFQQLVSDGTGGTYGANIDPTTGQVTLVLKNDKISMTSGQLAFYNTMLDATDPSQNLVSIALLQGSEAVLIGSHDLQAIDLTDINAFGATSQYVTSYSVLAHEISEQTYKQRGVNSGIGLADHIDAIRKVEDKMNGTIRDIPDPPSPNYIQDLKSVPYIISNPPYVLHMPCGTGTYNLGYTTSSGVHTIVALTIVNNNIISVK